MSTITDTASARDYSATQQAGTWSGRRHEPDEGVAYSTRIQVGEVSSVGLSHIVRAPAQQSGKRAKIDTELPKVKRRLQGFFIQAEGQEARVALVDKGTLVHYYLPLSILHEGGVRVENQPFELDELEAKVAGVVMTGHRVRASAPADASEVRPLPLNEEYQRKLNRILRR
jgi:hypothetical protein